MYDKINFVSESKFIMTFLCCPKSHIGMLVRASDFGSGFVKYRKIERKSIYMQVSFVLTHFTRH